MNTEQIVFIILYLFFRGEVVQGGGEWKKNNKKKIPLLVLDESSCQFLLIANTKARQKPKAKTWPVGIIIALKIKIK